MASDLSRRLLQVVNALLALTTIVLGGTSFLLGTASPVYPEPLPDVPALDSNLRFPSGLAVGPGLPLRGFSRRTIPAAHGNPLTRTEVEREPGGADTRPIAGLREQTLAGYSSTPLAKKLGIRARCRLRTTGVPGNYADLLDPLPQDVKVSNRIVKDIDIWHFFTRCKSELDAKLPAMRDAIYPDGAIWVSWPKKSSGVPSSVTEDTIRDIALPLGLVDVKVCAVDETWSGLKLVVRRELRG